MAAVVPSTDKPIVLVAEMVSHWRDAPANLGVHTTGSLREGLIALRALADYAAYRRRMPAAIHSGARRHLAINKPADGRTVLTEFESKRALDQAGMSVTREELAKTAEEAVAAAIRIGFPVALKVQSPNLMHKTDANAVALELKDTTAVYDAFQCLLKNVRNHASESPHIDGVLVQEMVHDGVEFLLGMHRDPVLGPVVVLSPGGIFVELFDKGAVLRLPPFGSDVADGMIESSPAARKLLSGFRGRPPADRAALVRLICEFATFVASLGEEIVAIDLNPVMVLPDGKGVKIVDAAIELAR
jgi:acyl-CoA synthetase (NDP forming)